MQGAFFIFHLLTKPFPSCDQPPIHLNHMTNHLTSHLTTHMTSHMPSSHLLLKRHLPYVTCFQITCASPDTPLPNSTWLRLPLTRLYSFTLAFGSSFSACLPFLSHKAPFFATHTDFLLVTFTRESVLKLMTPSFEPWLVTSTGTCSIRPKSYFCFTCI